MRLIFRYYSTEDRGVLQGEDWRTNSASYLKQLKCPYGFEKYQNAALDWLLNYAIRLEYSDKKDNIKWELFNYNFVIILVIKFKSSIYFTLFKLLRDSSIV